MDTSLQIGKIMGIPVRLHWTFLLIIPWVAYVFGSVSDQLFGGPYGFREVEPALVRWTYSLAFAILLFVCVSFHELGHSYVARLYGIGIRSITLYIFGGVAAMEDLPRDPKLELRMALAGPGVSGAIGIACLILYFRAAGLLGEKHPFIILLWTLGVMNLILTVFNLLPAFPMDGGRVLRAWLAKRIPYMVATSRAANIGKIFAVLMFFLGLFGGGILMIIVAIFVYMGASEEEKTTSINICLEGIKVRDIMSSEVHTVSPEITLKQLTELIFSEKHRGYPVMENGLMVGIVTSEDVRKVPEAARESTLVGSVMTKKIFDIRPDEEATAALKKMSELGVRRLPVILDGKLVGILSREDLVRAMELCSPL